MDVAPQPEVTAPAVTRPPHNAKAHTFVPLEEEVVGHDDPLEVTTVVQLGRW